MGAFYNPLSVAIEHTNLSDPAAIDPKQVARLSRLSRLGLSDDELQRLGSQLGAIVAAVDKLAEADTDRVDPTAQVGGLTNVCRPDVVLEGLSQGDALANAASQEAGLLRVPAIQ